MLTSNGSAATRASRSPIGSSFAAKATPAAHARTRRRRDRTGHRRRRRARARRRRAGRSSTCVRFQSGRSASAPAPTCQRRRRSRRRESQCATSQLGVRRVHHHSSRRSDVHRRRGALHQHEVRERELREQCISTWPWASSSDDERRALHGQRTTAHADDDEAQCARLMSTSEPWMTLGRDYERRSRWCAIRCAEVYVAEDRWPVRRIHPSLAHRPLNGYIRSLAVAPEPSRAWRRIAAHGVRRDAGSSRARRMHFCV